MSINDFETVDDSFIADEEFTGEQNVRDIRQVDVSKLLQAKELVEKTIDAVNDAAAEVGYEIGIMAEQARILGIIEHLDEQSNNEGVAKVLGVLRELIEREEDGKVTT